MKPDQEVCTWSRRPAGNRGRYPELGSDVVGAMFERNCFNKMIWKENRLDTGKGIQRIYYCIPQK